MIHPNPNHEAKAVSAKMRSCGYTEKLNSQVLRISAMERSIPSATANGSKPRRRKMKSRPAFGQCFTSVYNTVKRGWRDQQS